ncbi:hypothetical protein ACQKWADRAFT_260956 [Trichoderma austrokoningii]
MGGLEARTGASSGEATFKKRSRGWAMLGDMGERIPCWICLVLIMRVNARSFFFSFFFTKNMYIYPRVQSLFIDVCVHFYHKQKCVIQTFFDCRMYLQAAFPCRCITSNPYVYSVSQDSKASKKVYPKHALIAVRISKPPFPADALHPSPADALHPSPADALLPTLQMHYHILLI